ncbi:palmitoyltransferase ZDHHC1-like [Artemia franciscana]|uniref:palmitoyltransferase ZDHHC1-like n=1 Tax=Artemia franciscana TaxID=6661 RepID=UPI0032DAD647
MSKQTSPPSYLVSNAKGSDSRSEEAKMWRRKSGFHWPLHSQQLSGYIVLVSSVIFHHGTLIMGTPRWLRNILHIISGINEAVLVSAIIVATVRDPCEPAIKSANIVTSSSAYGRCHICQISVSDHQTKHCSICNKCVKSFDHHCKWLNQCVGGSNYKAFISAVLTSFVHSLIICGLSVYGVVMYFLCFFNDGTVYPWLQRDTIDDEEISVFVDNPCLDISYQFLTIPINKYVFVTIAFVHLIVALVAVSLLVHLLTFHAYINYLGITTYQYIRNQSRNSKDTSTKLSKQCPCFSYYSKLAFNCRSKNNRVEPSTLAALRKIIPKNRKILKNKVSPKFAVSLIDPDGNQSRF